MDERIQVYETKMGKTLANLESELGTIRAGRANPHVLDRILVDYYGSPTPIQQVANVTVPEARMIQIQPWEGSMVKVIEKAILTSDLGINPTNERKGHPPGIPGTDRGAQKRTGEGRQKERRECQSGQCAISDATPTTPLKSC